MSKGKTYDSKCFDLAEAFLGDPQEFTVKKGDAIELAQVIQDAIEDWLLMAELNRRPSFEKQIEGIDYFRDKGRPEDFADDRDDEELRYRTETGDGQ